MFASPITLILLRPKYLDNFKSLKTFLKLKLFLVIKLRISKLKLLPASQESIVIELNYGGQC